MKKFTYEIPSLEVVEVQVELGFADSQIQGDFETAGEDAGTWE